MCNRRTNARTLDDGAGWSVRLLLASSLDRCSSCRCCAVCCVVRVGQVCTYLCGPANGGGLPAGRGWLCSALGECVTISNRVVPPRWSYLSLLSFQVALRLCGTQGVCECEDQRVSSVHRVACTVALTQSAGFAIDSVPCLYPRWTCETSWPLVGPCSSSNHAQAVWLPSGTMCMQPPLRAVEVVRYGIDCSGEAATRDDVPKVRDDKLLR